MVAPREHDSIRVVLFRRERRERRKRASEIVFVYAVQQCLGFMGVFDFEGRRKAQPVRSEVGFQATSRNAAKFHVIIMSKKVTAVLETWRRLWGTQIDSASSHPSLLLCSLPAIPL